MLEHTLLQWYKLNGAVSNEFSYLPQLDVKRPTRAKLKLKVLDKNKNNKVKKMETPELKRQKLIVQILSMCFGFGSWIAMTGLWVELPLLTQKLPESWSLGSFLTVMIQLANIGPLIYWWARTRKICSEVTAIHLQMFIGTLACLALIFWWDTTAIIFGTERSIVLYLAAFGLSIVDCTSSVVFLPYMARFKGHHMTPYLIGEGLSGFLPSLVALAQGVSEEGGEDCMLLNTTESTTQAQTQTLTLAQHPRFSANLFFCFLLLILLTSWIAFTCMDLLAICREERIDLDIDGNELPSNVQMLGNEDKDDLKEDDLEVEVKSKCCSNSKYIWLLSLMGWGCFTTFGAMPSLQSYSCLPYGSETFFYAVTLAGLAYPGACFLALFVDIRSSKLINGLMIIGSAIGVYIIVCAAMSPYPPLKTQTQSVGSVIMVVSWFTYIAMISYVKTMISLELNDTGGNEAMFWCGFAQQFGAATGGALIFCIINFTNVFVEENKCE